MANLLFQKGRYFESKDSPYKNDYEEKKFHVFFRHVFTSVLPYIEAPLGFKCPGNIAITVHQLSHITHESSAAKIESEKSYVFKAFQNCGKAYERDGSPRGESFQDTFLSPSDRQVTLIPDEQMYRKIQSDESLMPKGCYSWWGVHVLDYTLNTGREMIENFQKDVPSSCPGYFKTPPYSMYGSIQFSGELHTLLKCYQNSRSSLRKYKPDVYLLLGGTHRYQCEICCVVIVCTEEDKSSEALKQYQPIPLHESVPGSNDPVLIPNGLVNNDGKVIDYSGECLPTFYPKYVHEKAWANLTFAFYFDNDCSGEITCGKSDMKQCHIQHIHCIRSQPPPWNGSWLCPDKIDREMSTSIWNLASPPADSPENENIPNCSTFN